MIYQLRIKAKSVVNKYPPVKQETVTRNAQSGLPALRQIAQRSGVIKYRAQISVVFITLSINCIGSRAYIIAIGKLEAFGVVQQIKLLVNLSREQYIVA